MSSEAVPPGAKVTEGLESVVFGGVVGCCG